MKVGGRERPLPSIAPGDQVRVFEALEQELVGCEFGARLVMGVLFTVGSVYMWHGRDSRAVIRDVIGARFGPRVARATERAIEGIPAPWFGWGPHRARVVAALNRELPADGETVQAIPGIIDAIFRLRESEGRRVVRAALERSIGASDPAVEQLLQAFDYTPRRVVAEADEFGWMLDVLERRPELIDPAIAGIFGAVDGQVRAREFKAAL